MTMTLEERITRLEDIETVRCLQARYQRCLDSRDFDGLADCFAEDAVSSYGNGSMAYRGRDEIIRFLCKVMTLDMPSSHLIHGGEVRWLDTEHAEADWYLEDHLLHKKFLVKLHGAAIYHVTYAKTDGHWLIASIGYERCYEYVELRGLVNLCSLRRTTLIDKVRRADDAELGPYGRLYRDMHARGRKKKRS